MVFTNHEIPVDKKRSNHAYALNKAEDTMLALKCSLSRSCFLYAISSFERLTLTIVNARLRTIVVLINDLKHCRQYDSLRELPLKHPHLHIQETFCKGKRAPIYNSTFHTFPPYIIYALVSYLLPLLILSPNLQNNHGIGANPTVKNANTLVAHPTPKLSYICNENNGNAALRVYLDNIAAPAAEAPYKGPYASIMNRFDGA